MDVAAVERELDEAEKGADPGLKNERGKGVAAPPRCFLVVFLVDLVERISIINYRKFILDLCYS